MYYLDIDNAIIIHDVKQIKKEPAQEKIKTMHKLSKKMKSENVIDGSKISIYTKLHTAQRTGYVKKPIELIEAVLKVLEVNENELVKKGVKIV